MSNKTYIFNFAHPLTEKSMDELGKLLPDGFEIVDCRNFRWENSRHFGEQIDEILRPALPYLSGEYPVAVNLPGLSMVSGLLIARIHGVFGSFPRVLNLRREEDGTFVVDRLIDLQSVRQEAREKLRS